MVITSCSNPQVIALRKLTCRRFRDREGTCWVEGVRLVSEALRTGATIESAWIAPDRMPPDARRLAGYLGDRGVRLVEVSSPVFDRLSSREGFQGIGAVVRQRWQSLDAVNATDGDVWMALDEVRYPGSLGTILRTCDAVGGGGAVLLGRSTDPYDPVAIGTSFGTVFSLTLTRATGQELRTWKDRMGVTIVGASPGARRDYREMQYPSPVMLMMGSERRAIQPEYQALCDHLVRIPMVGRTDSLHVSVAASVVLYEVFEQQRQARRAAAEGNEALPVHQ